MDDLVDDAAVSDESVDGEAPLASGGKSALNAERKARRDAERQLKDVSTRLAELESRDKSEIERLRDEVERLKGESEAASSALMRADVAFEKGLSPVQAKRLMGVTREELEADADEILAMFQAPALAPKSRPTPREGVGSDSPSHGETAKDRAVAAMRQLRHV